MVEFYAPWCGHCQSLAPEYAAAATELKGEAVALAKVDATEERELAEEYEVQGFPTVYFFVDGEHKPYTGQRTKEAIVTWIKKKIGPGVYNISTIEDAERVLTSENKVVLGFLKSLVGPESEELSSASKLEDNVNFYQTVNPDVAKLFHMDPDSKRPALVMLKREVEKLSHFDGQFKKSVIAEFVSANKLPLVTIFTRESGSAIFESPIKKQILLFATSNDSEKVIPTFQEAAKAFKGKLIFVYVEMDNEEVGRPVADYFGITGNSPKGKTFLLAFANFCTFPVLLDIQEIMMAFGEDFVQDKLKPFYKSDPIPEPNDEDVKIVVGDNFDDIVLDESKDVLLEIYAPWCGHCQALEPTYKKLAKHLRAIESLVIAKMDGATNEHPKAKADGFPTLLFFPAGNKSVDPITVDSDRTVISLETSVLCQLACPSIHAKVIEETYRVRYLLTLKLGLRNNAIEYDKLIDRAIAWTKLCDLGQNPLLDAPGNYPQMADSLLLGGRYPESALHRALEIAEICIREMPESWTTATYLVGSLNELASQPLPREGGRGGTIVPSWQFSC
ncbi:PDI-like 1-4 [Actinidia rufa]|uniref:protein disulfide-isomerase n=1 Tax=Actinidia rufa TaxID=165716 RepID=A0A7J0GQT7_9ERIC|nr:PDI-like 1-4 [Actinidia rufa]